MTKHKNFLKSYLNSFSEIIKYDENVAQKFLTFLSILKKLKKIIRCMYLEMGEALQSPITLVWI